MTRDRSGGGTPISRRSVLQGGLALGASAGLGLVSGALPARAGLRGGPPIEPGLQLYTVRSLLEQDFPGTLRKVAALGYREVQVSPRAGHAPTAIRSMLDDAGLRAPSIHMAGPPDQEIEAAHALGARFVFLSAPPQVVRRIDGKWGIRDDVSLDEWKRIAEGLNRTGARFAEAGLRFGYHNHAFEFVPTEGRLPFDVLVDETDPETVLIEIDLGWAQVGGVDPRVYFARYPGRFPVCHVKDVLDDGSFVDPGTGTVPFEAIFEQREAAGLRHYFVEHDTTKAPLETARVGFDFLRGLSPGPPADPASP